MVLQRPNASAAPRPHPPSESILFIGNSLTDANGLEGRVRELAGDAGTTIKVAAVARPGYSLEDHLANGPALDRIRSGRFGVVVLQQGPSTRAQSRADLIRDADRLAQEIRAVHARPVLLMVWPLPGQRQEDVSASYRAAAVATGSSLVPAGEAWQAARRRDPSLVFTGPDGFHPSALGTYLAALALHCRLHGRLPPVRALAVERERSGVPLTDEQARLLREAACAADPPPS
jgi:hypothetical protein